MFKTILSEFNPLKGFKSFSNKVFSRPPNSSMLAFKQSFRLLWPTSHQSGSNYVNINTSTSSSSPKQAKMALPEVYRGCPPCSTSWTNWGLLSPFARLLIISTKSFFPHALYFNKLFSRNWLMVCRLKQHCHGLAFFSAVSMIFSLGLFLRCTDTVGPCSLL